MKSNFALPPSTVVVAGREPVAAYTSANFCRHQDFTASVAALILFSIRLLTIFPATMTSACGTSSAGISESGFDFPFAFFAPRVGAATLELNNPATPPVGLGCVGSFGTDFRAIVDLGFNVEICLHGEGLILS